MQVICSSCGGANPPETRVCVGCSAPLGCSACGGAVPARARFCPTCGHAQDAPAPSAGALPAAFAAGERRQLTVMFCDLVDSTELSQRFDAEELREVMRAYHELGARIVGRFEGHVAQYLGDGLLVYFGFPHAHDDDAVRAVQAGLAMRDALPLLNERFRERFAAAGARELRIRIGIDTGPVVLATGGGRARDRIGHGETLNVAARLQGAAAPGSVEISARTCALVEGRFALESVGRRVLKGVAEPLEAWRVLRASGATTRIEAAARRGLTRLIGREHEIELLLDRFYRLHEGHGAAVLLSADGGVGKSRLVHTLRERLAAEPHAWLEARCAPEHEASAFRPAVELLLRGSGVAPDATADARLAVAERALARAGSVPEESLALIAPVLGAPVPPHCPPPPSNADVRRRRTLEALAAWLAALVGGERAIVVVEDLHWIDPSTLELLGLLLDQLADLPVLLLLTARPEFRSPWQRRADLLELVLHPLTRAQTRTMVDAVADGRALPARAVAEIVTRTDGVPLFVEELTRAVLESAPAADPGGAWRSAPLDIPSTLHGSLAARLDRLGELKYLVQVASVVGREFATEIVAAAAASTPALVERALERVVDAGLLLPAGEQTGARYAFKHALIQDAAYQSLLRSTRQELHARVAAALLARVPEIALSEPEVVARHYDVSGDVDAAARFYQRASEQAKNRSASAEAMRHAQRALALLDALPGSPERDLRELELQTSLGVMLMANRGSADATVEAIYERIRQLGEKIGEGAGLAQALFGLSHHHQARGELDSAQAVGASLLALAPRCEDDAVLVSAHLALGAPAFWRGDTGEALAHLLETTQRYDPVRHRALAYVYGQDPGVYSRSFAALVLHATGRRERALATSRDAVAHAQDEITRAFALAFAVVLHWMRREPDAAHAGADEVIRIAVEHSFPLWRGAGLLLRGWATAFARRDAAGLAELREGIAQLDATGTDVAVPLKLAIRADAEHAVGAHEEALATVAQALAESRRLGSHVVESRLECLRGQLLVALGRAPEGESALARAIEVAQQQEAHGSELDAAVELARFWAGRGCAERARTLLDESCARLGPLVDAALIEWTRGAVASVASG